MSLKLTEAVEIDWTGVSERTFDKMVGVLLSRVHGAKRRDGRGGDGGVDCFIETDEGLHVFQLKLFPGRVGSARRKQVQRSLKAVIAKYGERIASWSVVAPTDLTEGEEGWFARSTDECTFPCDWKGLTWLNSELAQRPDIPRFFLLDAHTEAVELLRDLHREEAALANGVPDAVYRVQRIAAQLDEINPFYRFDIASSGGLHSVTAFPRYPGAEEDSPIHVHVEFSFPSDDEGQQAYGEFREAIGFGRPTELPDGYLRRIAIDAPAGMGGEFHGGLLRLGAAAEEGLAIDTRLRIESPEGAPLSELLVRFDRRNRGHLGADLHGADVSGLLAVTMTLNNAAQKLNLTFEPEDPTGRAPSSVVQVLRFLEHCRDPNRVVLVAEGLTTEPIEIPNNDAMVEPGLLRVVEALDDLCRHSGVQIRLPAEIDPELARAISESARLVRGETITGSWTGVAAVMPASSVAGLTRKLAAEPQVLGVDMTQTLNLPDGSAIPIGQVWTTLHDPQIDSIQPTDTAVDSVGEDVSVHFSPGEDNRFTKHLRPST